MEKQVIVVCSVVGFLGLLSAATGLAAEAKRIKGDQVQSTSSSTCSYPRSPAFGLGLTSAVALMIAQITISAATFLVLLGGAFLNDEYDGDQDVYFGNYYCPGVKPGAFAGAAFLSLASVTLGLVYYLILTSEKKLVDTTQGGVAMGQPRFPSPLNAQDPVFVHEDTYVRRQFV